MSCLARLRQTTAKQSVSLGFAAIDSLQAPLLPSEAVAVSKAAPKRQREFTAGRTLARALIADAGEPRPIAQNADRSPRWPAGIVGSISHSDEFCAAAIAPSAASLSLGLDIETIGKVKRELWPLLFVATELASLERESDPAARALLATLMFSAKEALYKLQYPLTKAWAEFHIAEVERTSVSTFRIEHGIAHPKIPRTLQGEFGLAAPDTLLCLLLLSAS